LFGATFNGRVQDKNNSPISGATVTLWQPPNDRGYEQTTTNDGTFIFDGVREGEYVIRVDANGFDLLFGSVKLSGSTPHSLNVVLSPTEVGQLRKVRAEDPVRYGPNPPRPAAPGSGKNIRSSRLVHQVKPNYPASALGRAQMRGGTVTLPVLLRRDGLLDNLVVLDTPDSSFALEALVAVRQWRYTPTYVNDQPTEVNFTIRVKFEPY
jgi:TonB family protein